MRVMQWTPPNSRIRVDEWESYQQRAVELEVNIIDFLLKNESTAIYHIEQTRTSADPEYLAPLLMAVNYAGGHSEGQDKIIVQNVEERKGPWVLYTPPQRESTTLYLQDMVWPGIRGAKFNPEVDNHNKMRHWYLTTENPLVIIEEFRREGYLFSDEKMPFFDYEEMQEQLPPTTL